jgi:hypothetical protein
VSPKCSSAPIFFSVSGIVSSLLKQKCAILQHLLFIRGRGGGGGEEKGGKKVFFGKKIYKHVAN